MSSSSDSKRTYTIVEVCGEISLPESTVYHYIEREWIRPVEVAAHRFDEQDLSRLRLIEELKNQFDVNDEGVDLILHLLDQIHAWRRLAHHASAEPIV